MVQLYTNNRKIVLKWFAKRKVISFCVLIAYVSLTYVTMGHNEEQSTKSQTFRFYTIYKYRYRYKLIMKYFKFL